jgi:hypothetical protein
VRMIYFPDLPLNEKLTISFNSLYYLFSYHFHTSFIFCLKRTDTKLTLVKTPINIKKKALINEPYRIPAR